MHDLTLVSLSLFPSVLYLIHCLAATGVSCPASMPNLLLPWPWHFLLSVSWKALPPVLLLTCSITSTSIRLLLSHHLLSEPFSITLYKIALSVPLNLCFILSHCTCRRVIYVYILLPSSFHESVSFWRVRLVFRIGLRA